MRVTSLNLFPVWCAFCIMISWKWVLVWDIQIKMYQQAEFLLLGIHVKTTMTSVHYKPYLYKTLLIYGFLWALQIYCWQRKPLRHPLEKEWYCPSSPRGWKEVQHLLGYVNDQWQNPEQHRQLLELMAGILEEVPVKDFFPDTHSHSHPLCLTQRFFCVPAC